LPVAIVGSHCSVVDDHLDSVVFLAFQLLIVSHADNFLIPFVGPSSFAANVVGVVDGGLAELAKNRTVLVVAHHLKTIQKADQILVFQKGNLLEKGKHGELLEKDGYYTKLWKAQYEV